MYLKILQFKTYKRSKSNQRLTVSMIWTNCFEYVTGFKNHNLVFCINKLLGLKNLTVLWIWLFSKKFNPSTILPGYEQKWWGFDLSPIDAEQCVEGTTILGNLMEAYNWVERERERETSTKYFLCLTTTHD
jgi:hypothetical protein